LKALTVTNIEAREVRKMQCLDEILRRSREVDKQFASLEPEELSNFSIRYRVPEAHPRRELLSEYYLRLGKIDEYLPWRVIGPDKRGIFIVADSVSQLPFVTSAVSSAKGELLVLESDESRVKNRDFLEPLANELEAAAWSRMDVVVVVGGGLLLNTGAFLAERLGAGLILFPTTVLSMADGAGGKVRLNALAFGRCYKHYYKSFYEPDMILLDPRFLTTLPISQIRIGLVEIIKHALFQSPALYEFLIHCGGRLFFDRGLLIKAIAWAADLKRICLDIDVEENENGSRSILRAGHDFSDRLEEDSFFRIPHGLAVAVGIMLLLQKERQEDLACRAQRIFELFGIPARRDEAAEEDCDLIGGTANVCAVAAS
jgi:3-dehydroquinate synthetase